MSSQEVEKAGGSVFYPDPNIWNSSGGGGKSNLGGSVADIRYNPVFTVSDTGPKSSFGSAQADTPSEKDIPVDNAVTRDEMLARLEAVDARNDARLKEFIGEVRLSNQVLKSEIAAEIKEIGGQIAAHRLETSSEFVKFKSETLDRSNTVIGNVWGAAIAIAGLTLAILAFGNDRFSSGLSITEYIHQVVAQRTVLSAPVSAPTPK